MRVFVIGCLVLAAACGGDKQEEGPREPVEGAAPTSELDLGERKTVKSRADYTYEPVHKEKVRVRKPGSADQFKHEWDRSVGKSERKRQRVMDQAGEGGSKRGVF